MPYSRQKIFAVVLALLLIGTTVAHAVWITFDKRPQPFGDPYLPQTLRFYDKLSQDGLAAVSYESLGRLSLQGRPVLYQILTLPFFRLFGRNADSMLSVNLIFNVLLMIAVYRTAALIKNPWTGLLAVLIVSAYPPISNLVKIARPQSVMPGCAALAFWLMFILLKNPSCKTAWLWGAALGFGALIHPNGLQVLGPISLVFGMYLVCCSPDDNKPSAQNSWAIRIDSRLRGALLWKKLFPAALITSAIAGMWYIPYFQNLMALARFGSRCCRDLTDGFPHIERSWFWYWQTMPGALSFFFALLFAGGIMIFFFSRNRERRWLSYSLVLAYVILSGRNQGSLNWMYFAQVLPAAGILTAVFVSDIRDWILEKSIRRNIFLKIAANSFLGLTVLHAMFNFYVVNAPLIFPITQRLSWAVGRADEVTCAWPMNVAFCPNPPAAQDWTAPEVIAVLGNDPKCANQNCTLTMINQMMDQGFHQTNLVFFLVQKFPYHDVQIKNNVVTMTPDGTLIMDRTLNWLTSDYVMYIPDRKVNRYDREVIRLLEQNITTQQDIFEIAAVSRLPTGDMVKLLRLRRRPSFAEALDYIFRLDVHPGTKELLVLRAKKQFF